MSTRVVILGLLPRKPLHGYEIKQIIESHMGDWTSIAFGSIYFALDKLSDEGLVERASVEQHGNRPSRSIFRITGKGREEFLRLLRKTWNEVERSYFDLDIGLFFIFCASGRRGQGGSAGQDRGDRGCPCKTRRARGSPTGRPFDPAGGQGYFQPHPCSPGGRAGVDERAARKNRRRRIRLIY